MKKIISTILMTLITLSLLISPASSFDVPEAYMGFSVPENFYVFSKNMTDKALLDAVDMTVKEINEALDKSDCEYMIISPEVSGSIYVKVNKNELSYELYNISETEDHIITESVERILEDGFSVDKFQYNPEDITIKTYTQMKFLIVPGTVLFDGKQHGMVFGATFVNGNGIGFIMYLEEDTFHPEDIKFMEEIASTLSFTVIKEKGSQEILAVQNEEKQLDAISYIAGGLGGVAMIALCFLLISKTRKTDRLEEEEDENREDTENQGTHM